MKQEKRITYQAGITRTPSDFLCNDGELAECINLVADNEELKPVVQPKKIINAAQDASEPPVTVVIPTLLYVHRFRDTTNYIGLDANNYLVFCQMAANQTLTRLGYLDKVPRALTGDISVESIGKTLIVSDSTGGLHYYLWDGGEGKYKDIGSDMPELMVKFSLTEPAEFTEGEQAAFSLNGFIHHSDPVYDGSPNPDHDYYRYLYYENEEYEDFKNAMTACVSKRISEVKGKKKFAFPFFARFAYRLYDGRYTRISNPVLMFPSYTHNCNIFFSFEDGNPQNMYCTDWDGAYVNYRPICSELRYEVFYKDANDAWTHYDSSTHVLDDWGDIIKGIDIFVSMEQKPFDMNEAWRIINPFDEEHKAFKTTLYNEYAGGYSEVNIRTTSWSDHPTGDPGFVPYFGPTHLTKTEIEAGLLEKSSFYKVAKLDVSDFPTPAATGQTEAGSTLTSKIIGQTLVNLENQVRLKEDDYFSHVSLKAAIMKTYNSRLHLADYWRGFFEGFDQFTSAAFLSSYHYVIVVYIDADDGERIAVKEISSNEVLDLWFYYPDPRAKSVELYYVQSGTAYLFATYQLTEHPWLNGAYHLDIAETVPVTAPSLRSGVSEAEPPDENLAEEHIVDELIYSEVYNPFVFGSKCKIRIGQGTIIGLATQTVALGQEEHGIHPMIVFASRGCSILRLGEEGIYLRADELSREVCLSKSSIIETDGAVYFASKKGLMRIVGESTVCVSGQMNGAVFNTATLEGLTPEDMAVEGAPTDDWKDIIQKCQSGTSFKEYITSARCIMAYDYVDSRLLICFKGISMAYAYSMADGSITKVVLPFTVEKAVNAYPDYLMQGGTKKIYSLYGKTREEDVADRQTAFLLTRPMKMSGPVRVSSLRELVNVGCWDEGTIQIPLSVVKTDIWCSDNLRDWYLMKSRMGAAAKYFRIGFYIRMLPKERLSGTIVMEEERRDYNKRV